MINVPKKKKKKITSNAKGEALALLACKCQECINETKTMKRGKKEDETPADGEGISLFSPEKKKKKQTIIDNSRLLPLHFYYY